MSRWHTSDENITDQNSSSLKSVSIGELALGNVFVDSGGLKLFSSLGDLSLDSFFNLFSHSNANECNNRYLIK